MFAQILPKSGDLHIENVFDTTDLGQGVKQEWNHIYVSLTDVLLNRYGLKDFCKQWRTYSDCSFRRSSQILFCTFTQTADGTVEQFRANSKKLGSTDSSVGRASDSWSQGRRFDPHPGWGVVSLIKPLHPHCLVLVNPMARKPFQNDRKIVDRDVKPQTNKSKKLIF